MNAYAHMFEKGDNLKLSQDRKNEDKI
jgi:hypothetical protein